MWRQRSGSTLAQVVACCLTAPSHYLNNVDLSLVRSSDIQVMAISQSIPQSSTIEFTLKITYLKFHSNLPGANEWTLGGPVTQMNLRCVQIVKWFRQNLSGTWPYSGTLLVIRFNTMRISNFRCFHYFHSLLCPLDYMVQFSKDTFRIKFLSPTCECQRTPYCW